MATHMGSEGTVKIGANAVAEIESFSLTLTATNAEKVALGDAYVARTSGIKDANGTVTCFWDETDTTGQEAMTAGATVALNLYPEGATTGDTYFTGNALITDVQVDVSGNNDITKRTFTFVNADNSGITQATAA